MGFDFHPEVVSDPQIRDSRIRVVLEQAASAAAIAHGEACLMRSSPSLAYALVGSNLIGSLRSDSRFNEFRRLREEYWRLRRLAREAGASEEMLAEVDQRLSAAALSPRIAAEAM